MKENAVTLNLLNRQRKVKFHVDQVRDLMLQAMEKAGIPRDAEVTVLFVSDDRIRRLNNEWRGIDAPTDCLSFPMQDDSPDPLGDDTYLGDIVISVQTAQKQAGIYFPGASDRDGLVLEILVLFVHSLLHLLGYDHHTQAEREKMSARERRILSALFPEVEGLTER